jgi:hypothetical protein
VLKLDFLKAVNIDEVCSTPKRTALIDGFALERSINLIWSPAGSGKTSLMFAVAKELSAKAQEVAFIDADNGIDLLQDRGYDKVIREMGKHLKYVNADMFDDPKRELMAMLEDIRKHATGGNYANCVFIFDSLKFFLNGGIYDEDKIERFIAFCKTIRRNGGIVWVLNHATKSGETMKGGQSLVDAVDECWEMRVLTQSVDAHNYVCIPQKERMKVTKVGFSVNKQTYNLLPLDVEIAEMSDNEKEFVEAAQAKLDKQHLKQGDLLKELGKEKADKTALEWLKKHEGRFWNSKKEGKEKVYTTVTTIQLNAKSA